MRHNAEDRAETVQELRSRTEAAEAQAAAMREALEMALAELDRAYCPGVMDWNFVARAIAGMDTILKSSNAGSAMLERHAKDKDDLWATITTHERTVLREQERADKAEAERDALRAELEHERKRREEEFSETVSLRAEVGRLGGIIRDTITPLYESKQDAVARAKREERERAAVLVEARGRKVRGAIDPALTAAAIRALED